MTTYTAEAIRQKTGLAASGGAFEAVGVPLSNGSKKLIFMGDGTANVYSYQVSFDGATQHLIITDSAQDAFRELEVTLPVNASVYVKGTGAAQPGAEIYISVLY